MANLPGASLSPRIEQGVLCWYSGDTFTLNLTLELTDQDGAAIHLTSGDAVGISFRDACGRSVKTFSFPPAGGSLSSDTLPLAFDAETSALFPKGEYAYDVCFTRAGRTTLAHSNKAVVE